MKAITLKQPWASLVASGLKQVENRTWPVPRTIRGERIAVHAGKDFDPDGLEAHLHNECRCDGQLECDACRILYYLDEHQHESKKVAGRILCTARIVGQYVDGLDQEWFIDTPCCTCEGTGTALNSECEYCDGTGQHFDSDLMFSETSNYCRSCSGVGEHLHCGVDARGSITCTSCQGSGQTKRIYNWILADVELVSNPTIYRGKLGLWELPDEEVQGGSMSRLTKEEIIALGLEGMHPGEPEVLQIEIKDPYPPTRYSGVIEPKTGHTMFFRHAATEPWTPVSTMHIENCDLLRVSVRDGVVYIEADADGAQQGGV